MAEAIKKSDIIEGKPFEDIANEITKTLDALEKYDAKIVSIAKHMKGDLAEANTKTLKGIEQATNAEIRAQKLINAKLDTDRKKIQLEEIKRRATEANAKAQTSAAEQKAKQDEKELQRLIKLEEQESKRNKKYEADFDKLMKKEQAELDKKIKAEEKAHSLREKQYNKEIQAQEKLDAIASKKAEKEAKENERLNSIYTKVDRKLSGMVKQYRDLAIRKELGVKLTDKEQKSMEFLSQKIQKYDQALKAVDASSGRHQRNVGNYSSAFYGLGFSVTQLAREMPAFANSMQTGFMAISNNLPMFFDEIQKLKQANIELVASGQAPKSVFKSLASTLMSTQVLLSVGVTLLTLYGAELVKMAGGLFNVTDASEKARKAKEEYNKQLKKSREFLGQESAEFVGNIMALKASTAGSKERLDAIKNINEEYNTTLKNLKDETAFQLQLNQAVEDYIESKRNEWKIKRNQELIDQNLQKQEKLRKDLAQAQTLLTLSEQKYNEVMQGSGDYMGIATKNYEEQRKKVEQLESELKGAEERLISYGIAINNAQKGVKDYTKQKDKSAKKTKEFRTEIEYSNDYISQQIELLRELQDLENERLQRLQQQNIEDVYANMMKRVTETGELEVDELERLINEKKAQDIAYLDSKTKAEIAQLEFVYNEEFKLRRKAIDEKYQDLLKQENLSKEARLEIEKNYNKALADLDAEELKRVEDLESKKVIIAKKAEAEKVVIADNANNEIKDKNDELIEAQIRFYDKQNEIAKEAAKKRLEQQKEMMDSLRKIEEGITKAIQEQIDRRIDILGRQADAAAKQADILKGLAESGNIQAQQSLKEQLDYQREIQREQIRLEKQKQNVEAVSAGLKVFLSEIEQGKNPASALASAFVSTNILVNTLKGLSFFEKGTQNAPEGLAVVDEKGKELITDKNGNIKALGSDGGARMTYLNKGDKVYTATQTASLLDQINLNNRFGREVTTKSNDLKILQSGLKSIETAIQNKAETQIHWETLTMVSRTKRNGVTTTNRFVNR